MNNSTYLRKIHGDQFPCRIHYYITDYPFPIVTKNPKPNMSQETEFWIFRWKSDTRYVTEKYVGILLIWHRKVYCWYVTEKYIVDMPQKSILLICHRNVYCLYATKKYIVDMSQKMLFWMCHRKWYSGYFIENRLMNVTENSILDISHKLLFEIYYRKQ